MAGLVQWETDMLLNIFNIKMMYVTLNRLFDVN